jgi:galactokinase
MLELHVDDIPPNGADPAARLEVRFTQRFGVAPRVYRAPGRVNLIGEHTDYNEGYVLPAAIPLSCWVAAAPQGGGRLTVEFGNVGQRTDIDLHAGTDGLANWARYLYGVAAGVRARGYDVPGAMLLIGGDVPLGAGLGSSASLEVATTLALADIAGADLSPLEVARIGQQAEIEYAGARCGLMDQFVSTHGRSGHAVLLDCRSLEHELVPLPPGLQLVACNTMVSHAHAGGEYNKRRAECERGVALIAAHEPDVRSLRDVDPALLEKHRRHLPELTFARCRHVVSENARVLEFVHALRAGDLQRVSALMAASHQSLRDDYAVSCAELDLMVEVASSAPGVRGARMTGGGFGGCTVNLVERDAADAFVRHVASEYKRQTQRVPDIYLLDAGDGAGRVS